MTTWHLSGNNVVDEDGTLVVSVPRPKGAGASSRRDARARLIAAAPELLEALKALDLSYGRAQDGDVQDKIDAAISKAEGK